MGSEIWSFYEAASAAPSPGRSSDQLYWEPMGRQSSSSSDVRSRSGAVPNSAVRNCLIHINGDAMLASALITQWRSWLFIPFHQALDSIKANIRNAEDVVKALSAPLEINPKLVISCDLDFIVMCMSLCTFVSEVLCTRRTFLLADNLCGYLIPHLYVVEHFSPLWMYYVRILNR